MITEEEPCLLDVEIQSLKAIFAEELQVNRPEENGAAVESLVLQMTPESSKGENVQFVRFEIVLEIPSDYPQALPKITLRNVRGLSEEAQTRTKEDMMKRAAELSGTAMLFELIQVAKEQFTSENTPSVPCSICLFSFDSEDLFSRTPCFHFFHTHCLANHVQYTLAQKDSSQDKGPPNETSKEDAQDVMCPVCRLPIPFKESDPEKYPVPKESLKETVESVLTPELRKMQQEMAELYSQQLAKGGIINLEAEKNKFFIEISNTPDLPVLPSALISPNSAKQNQSASSTTDVPSSETASEHIQKQNSSNPRKFQGQNATKFQSSSKPHSKGQYRKPNSQADNSDKKPTEEKKWSNWDTTEPTESSQTTESPRRASPYKSYSKGQNQRQSDGFYDERYKRSNEDESGGFDSQENRAERQGRRRNQFYDKRQGFRRGYSHDNDGSQSKEAQDGRENESESNYQENSYTRPPYRGNAKKKYPYRHFRSNDTNDNNQHVGTSNQSEAMSNKDVQVEADNNKSQDVNAESNKNFSNTSINDGQTRGHKSYNNRYDYRTNTKRFNKERPFQNNGGRYERTDNEQNDVKEDCSEDKVKNSDIENQLPDREHLEDRFKGNNSRYRNNMSGKNRMRGKNYRSDYGQDNNVEQHNVSKSHENSNTEASSKNSENIDDKQITGKDQQYSEQDLNVSSQTGDNGYRQRPNENRDRRNEYPRTNRRYQRNYPNAGETDSYLREDTREHSGNVQKSRYWNRHDNFRKQENPNYYQDNNENRNTNNPNAYPHDGVSQNDNTRKYDGENQSGRGNFRSRGNRKQRYGNSRSDFTKDQQANETAVPSDSALAQSGTNDQCSEVYEDSVGRKTNDSRTNRSNWKGRNSHQRYSYPQSSASLMSQSNLQASGTSSRTDPSVSKPNIKPFTLMYNSSTQDAQSLVSIPPPF